MRSFLAFAALAVATPVYSAPLPVIDMHLHAMAADDQGPPPLGMCTPFGPKNDSLFSE